MKIAVLSGKGGAGKTLVAVNLAAVAGEATYLDCDVEEPNGRLFFRPQEITTRPVTVGIPQVDQQKCTGCKVCVDFCAFNALALTGDRLVVFPEICHSCGGCFLLCPEDVLTEKEKVVGQIEQGVSGQSSVLTGVLKPGEASGTPIVKELIKEAAGQEQVIIDCPPGSACIVMETVAAADYCVLVAEPTVFGVHNLNMVWELVRLMNKPCGVVLNKCLEAVNPAEDYCRKKGITILGRIPYSPQLALLSSEGRIAALVDGDYAAVFEELLCRVKGEVTR